MASRIGVDVDHGGLGCAALNMKVVGQPAAPRAEDEHPAEILPAGDPPYRRERSVVLFVVPVRPTPIPKQATDVVARPARQPDAFTRRQRISDGRHENRRDVRDLFCDRAGERLEPRPRRAADAWFGSLELEGMIRLARLLDDEPELHAPVLDVRGGVRQQDPDAVQARIGLSARHAADGAVEPGPATGANRGVCDCLRHTSVLSTFPRSAF